MRQAFALLLAITVLCSFVGCDDSGTSSSGNTPLKPGPGFDPGKGPADPNAGGGPPAVTPVTAEEFDKMMKEDKPSYAAKLALLKEKAATLSGEEQKKLNAQIADAEERFNDITSRYESMDTKDGHWGSVSGGMKMSWEQVKKDIDTALGDFQGAPKNETTTAPSTDTTEPSTDTTEPSTDTTEPSTDTTEPSTDTTEPSTDTTEPSTDTTAPATP